MNQFDCLGILNTFPSACSLFTIIKGRRVLETGDLKLIVVDFKVEPDSTLQDEKKAAFWIVCLIFLNNLGNFVVVSDVVGQDLLILWAS